MLKQRSRAIVSGLVVFLAFSGLVVAALLADGRTASESETNDGGAWLLNRSQSSIGHVNRVVGEISNAVGPFSGQFDVSQAESVVVVHNKGAGQAVLLDTNLATPGSPVSVSETTTVAAGPGVVVLHDRSLGAVWRFRQEEFAAVETLASIAPHLEGGVDARPAVGRDGTVALADPANGSVQFLGLDGAASGVTDDSWSGAEVVDFTLVGSMGVVALTDQRLVIVEDGKSRVVDTGIDMLVLQQSSPEAAEVVGVSAAGEVVHITLATGAVAATEELAGAVPLKPIVYDGCVWAVTVEPTPVLYHCGRTSPLTGASSQLKLTLVNGWVWVNDVDQGGIWFVREDNTLRDINDWTAALAQNENEDDSDSNEGGEEDEVVNPDADELQDIEDLDEDDLNENPIAEDDESSTRQGRVVVVSVLDNDVDPDNDPLAVEDLIGVDADGRTSDGAQITITADGTAIQVTPTQDFVGEIRFEYRIHDGRQGRDTATVRVKVEPRDESTNRPPFTVVDNATVRAGKSVTVNVLSNDSDPDGDVLVLTDVSTDGLEGVATYAPDGQVTYSPDSTSNAGTIELPYTVADDFGAEARGIIKIRVRPADSNQPPQARSDVGRTTVGRPVFLNVLGNDVDPDGDPLFAQNLQSLDGSPTTARLTPDGRFLFTPDANGSFRFTYVVTDGPEADQAQIRIDVEPSDENRPPIAVVDEVALALGESRLVRVLDNDGDPDGDIVGIVDFVGVDGLEIDEVAGVGFTVLATPSAQPRSTFRYWISDGLAPPVQGSVIVSALAREPVDYPPFAVADIVDVRAGQTSEIAVLRNDHDPEGGAIRIAEPIAQIPEGLLRISPDGQLLLLTVPEDQVFSFQFAYDVEDAIGNRASAVVQVRIVPSTQVNRPPIAGPDIARTSAESEITIAVLENDFDPDGDPIAVESIAEQPQHGTVEILADDSIVYSPDKGFSGTDKFVYTLVDGYQAPAESTLPADQSGPGRSRGEVFVGVMPESPANRPPTAIDDVDLPPVEIGSGSVNIPVLANDSDPDNDPIRITNMTVVTVGEAQIAGDGGWIEYTPPETGESREVAFTYSIADGRDGVDSAQVVLQLELASEPPPPVAVDDTVGPVRAGSEVTLDPRLNDVDVGPVAELTVLPGDSPITVLGDGRIVLVAPDATSDVPYRVRNAGGAVSEIGFITVLVTENEAPEVAPISVTTPYNTPITIDIHDFVTDVDDDPLVMTLGTLREGGSVQVSQSGDNILQVQFTPDTDFEGVARFDFLVDDRNGHIETGSVMVEVEPPENRPPEASPIVAAAEAGVRYLVRLSDFVTDEDGTDDHTYTITGPSRGNVVLDPPNGVGEVWIASSVNQGGETDSFDYTVSDGEFTSTNTVSINLAVAQFPPPSLTDDVSSSLQGNLTAPISVLENDVDNSPVGLEGDGLEIVAVGVSPDGVIDRQGSDLVFTPNAEFFGTATFTYSVQDGRRSTEGESTATVTVDVIGLPDKPQPPSIASVGDQYLVVTWQPPQAETGRAPVEGYLLQYSGGAGSDSITFITPTTNYRWESLTNAVEYCFQVAAVNQAGQGEFSDAIGTAECGTPDVRPEAPTAPTVTFGNGEILVNWAEPLNAGSSIQNYQLRLSGGQQTTGAELGVVTQFLWTGLTNGTDYTFEVRAQNAAVENGGWSEWSAFSTQEHPNTLPDAPPQPVAQRGDQQVVVTWSAPGDGGDPITRYDVRSVIGGTPSAWVPVTPQGTANTHNWQGIPNGTSVSFEVRAINRDPASTTPGNISPASVPVTTCTVPDAPAQPAVVRGDTQVTVSWVPPSAQGCAISEYQITSSAGTQTAAAGVTSYDFTGLTNGTPYTFTVTAINEVVTGEGGTPRPSSPSASVTPAGPPIPAPNLTEAVNVGVRQVRLSWTPPNDNGDPITHYEVSVNGGGWASVGDVTTVVRNEPTNGAVYSYVVRAVNGVGPSAQSNQRSVTTWNVPGTSNVTASASPGNVSVSWSAAAANGTAIIEYQVDISRTTARDGVDRTVTGRSTSFSVTNGVTYRVWVRARNAVGWGPWSAPSNAVTPALPQSASISWGPIGGAQGQPGCSASLCTWVRLTAENLTPNTTYNVICQEDLGGWVSFYTGPRTTNSSGAISLTNFCYYGIAGTSVRIVVGSVPSNSLQH